MKPILCIALLAADGRRAYPLVQLHDAGLLSQAASLAVSEKEALAVALRRQDEALGVVASAEAQRLRSTLDALIPQAGARPVA